jgi:putative hemolysin
MISLIVYFLISHIVSFICSVLEAVLLCCTTAYIGILRKKDPAVGQILHDLKMRIDRPLAAILTLNTAAHTFGAAGVGASAVELFGDHTLAIVSVILTLTMLFITEMFPKTLGALYWKKLTTISAYTIKYMIVLTYPFVIAFEFFARYLARGKTVHEKITGEEIRLLLQEGAQAGVLKEVEYDMVESIFRLGNLRVGVLMIPRLDIEWLDLNKSPQELRAQIEGSQHSRFPVCDGDLDEVVGMITSKILLTAILDKGSFNLREIVHPPLFIPENMRILQLLDLFKKTPDHIALVTDEYRGVQGLITLHDVLESIIGDVQTSSLNTENQIIQRKDGSWLIDGMLPIDELKEHFSMDSLPDEEKAAYRTLGGFCMHQIGSIPQVGDTFNWGKFKFRIIKMDGHRVERVLVHSLE